jgi:hypothetical protein
MLSQFISPSNEPIQTPVRDKKVIRERNRAIRELANSLLNMGLDKEEVKSLYRIVERN